MTEGLGGLLPDDEDEAFASRATAGRVFSLDDGGLTAAPGLESQAGIPHGTASAPLVPGAASLQEVPPTPVARAPLGWDEISPERLRESAAVHQSRGVFSDADVAPPLGMAWYEVILGCLLGIAATLAMYEWSAGGLGPFVVVPSIVLGLGLLAVPRHDVRHVGFGLLASVPVAALLGLGLWYAAEVF